MINISGLHVYLFYGKKGSGKSLYTAYLSIYLMNNYIRLQKKYPKLPHRKLYTNIKFSPKIEVKYKEHFNYWTHPEELYDIRNADIVWDEIGKDLPTSSWATTPKEVKAIFSHLRKRGNRLFANTQVYEDVDVTVRRQTDHAYLIRKMFGSRDISATLPNPRLIYGMILINQFDPLAIEYQRDPDKRESIKTTFFPHFILINKNLVEIYDTQNELPPYQVNKLKELIMECREGVNCQHKSKDGAPHRVINHVPV